MSHKRKIQEKRRLKKLYDATWNQCVGGAFYSERKARFIRYWPSSSTGYTKWLRRRGNRKLRRGKEIYQGGQYRKLFDYWWELI